MKNLFKPMIIGLFAATPAFSGGWEASRLDTSMMYNDGGHAEVGTSSITYDINGTTQAPASATHKMAKNQTRTALGVKTQVLGAFDIGLSSYRSGAIQLDGQATAAQPNCTALNKAALNFTQCSVVPSADVEVNSLALMGRYRVNDNMSFLGALNRYDVSNATVTTMVSHFVVSGDIIAPVIGAAYENKEIALRVELLMQTETDVPLTVGSSVASAVPTVSVPNAKMVIPQTLTLNFQSGIAEDTLLFGSIHQADWDSAQITIPEINNGVNPTTAALDQNVKGVSSSFSTKTAYSVGIGRKINENFSALGSYSTEAGGGATSADPFTLTDGSQTLGLGVRYTRNNMTITGGYSYTKVGDVTVTYPMTAPHPSMTATYANNKVTGLGLKIGFSF
jgi:long-chain fatty acid transport protein